MKYTIKKRDSDEVLVEGEAESFRDFVEKNKMDLRGADLSKTDLSGVEIKASQKEALLKALRIDITEEE
ncbi:MAG: hypothetical protein ACOZBH_04455 [Patescibacteria group bacterium]